MKNLLLITKFQALCEKAFIDDRYSTYSEEDVEVLTIIHERYSATNNLTDSDEKAIREILKRY